MKEKQNQNSVHKNTTVYIIFHVCCMLYKGPCFAAAIFVHIQVLTCICIHTVLDCACVIHVHVLKARASKRLCLCWDYLGLPEQTMGWLPLRFGIGSSSKINLLIFHVYVRVVLHNTIRIIRIFTHTEHSTCSACYHCEYILP